MKATPSDAKGEALHGTRGFVGDFHTHSESFRLFADPENEQVTVVPVSNVDGEFSVDATLGRKKFRNVFYAHAKRVEG